MYDVTPPGGQGELQTGAEHIGAGAAYTGSFFLHRQQPVGPATAANIATAATGLAPRIHVRFIVKSHRAPPLGHFAGTVIGHAS